MDFVDARSRPLWRALRRVDGIDRLRQGKQSPFEALEGSLGMDADMPTFQPSWRTCCTVGSSYRFHPGIPTNASVLPGSRGKDVARCDSQLSLRALRIGDSRCRSRLRSEPSACCPRDNLGRGSMADRCLACARARRSTAERGLAQDSWHASRRGRGCRNWCCDA